MHQGVIDTRAIVEDSVDVRELPEEDLSPELPSAVQELRVVVTQSRSQSHFFVDNYYGITIQQVKKIVASQKRIGIDTFALVSPGGHVFDGVEPIPRRDKDGLVHFHMQQVSAAEAIDQSWGERRSKRLREQPVLAEAAGRLHAHLRDTARERRSRRAPVRRLLDSVSEGASQEGNTPVTTPQVVASTIPPSVKYLGAKWCPKRSALPVTP
eukprot:5224416-Amphidinium_carterae.1